MKKKPLIATIALTLILLLPVMFACAPEKEVEPEDTVPATLVGPTEGIPSAPALLLSPIDFSGSNWKPGELVIIELIVPEGIEMPSLEAGEDSVGIAFGTADDEGNLEASVEGVTKLNYLLRMGWQPNMLPDIETYNPLPPGTYTVRATGFDSGKVATCALEFVPLE